MNSILAQSLKRQVLHNPPPRIFVTGLFGTGKTTVCTHLKRELSEYDSISLDYDIGYYKRSTQELVEQDQSLHQKLTSNSNVIMDALPEYHLSQVWDSVGETPKLNLGGMPKFFSYAKSHECMIVLLTCTLDHWLNVRVPKKKSDVAALVAKDLWREGCAEWTEHIGYYDYFHKTYAAPLIKHLSNKLQVIDTTDME